MREIELSFQKNIRDLGGLPPFNRMKVKNGRLFRGGFLDKITPEDAEILKSLHITDIIDFRSKDEHENRPGHILDGVVRHNFPVMQDHVKKEDRDLSDGNLLWFVSPDSSGFEHMRMTYRELVTEEVGKNGYRQFFKLLMSKRDGVFYFHCSQGKDRAGLAAYLLETALGFPEETCVEDYLFTNKAMKHRIDYLFIKIKDKKYYNEKYHASFIDVFSAKIEYLNAAIEEMKKQSGSVLNYIKKELNVDVNLLREIYLESI